MNTNQTTEAVMNTEIEASIEQDLANHQVCPYCRGKNIADRYDELRDMGQTARGCADPILWCMDCKRWLN